MKKKRSCHRLFKRPWRKILMIMKLFILLTCCFTLTLSASSLAQQEKVSLSMKNVAVQKLFDEIQRQTNLYFLFNMEQVNRLGKITVVADNETVESVLNSVFKDSGLTYMFNGNMIVVRPREMSEDEKKSLRVKGFVRDEKKQPMPGVTVKVVGVAVGTATNEKGWFAMDLPMLKGALEFSFVGYKKQQVSFTEKTDTLQIVMEEDVSDLDEVVVRAYGSQNRREVVSAISSVKAEEMKELPTASIVNMLQGRLAGVAVVNQSGAPGSASVVAVRGFNSLLTDGASDGQPLYVVDGVPMHSFVSPVTGTNTMADLDPSMIESVEVLKDAAAASIYGSRAGNGVILITTKKGRVGETKFSANVSYSASQLMSYPLQTGGRLERWIDILIKRNTVTSGYDYAVQGNVYPASYTDVYNNQKGTFDAFWGNGRKGIAVADELQDSLNPFYNNQTNWWKYVFRTGKILNANVQASGGSNRFSYMAGVGYYTETGIMNSSSYKRFNVISNLSATPSEMLRMDIRLYGAYVDRSRNANNPLSKGRFETMTADPTKQSTLLPATNDGVAKWLEKMNSTVDKSDDYRGMGSVYLEFKPVKGLVLSAKGSIDFSQGNKNTFKPSTLDNSWHENKSEGEIMRTIAISNEELVRYNLSLNQKHNFDVLFGFNVEKNAQHSIGGWGKAGVSDYVYYYNPNLTVDVKDYGSSLTPNYKATRSYSSSFTEKAMVSYFGRVGYNYKQRYLIEATFRRDGSSTFGEDNKWANFPSVAIGWAFSEERFMKWADWLDWGKLRGSYGTSGQVFTDAYLAHGLMRAIKGPFIGESGVTVSSAISPDLTWEKTEQYNIGLDLDMFNYRVKMKLDYYYKYTSSLIYSVPLPATILIADRRTENAMAISNEGIELEAEFDILRESAVSWRMKLNVSRNWNRFEESYNERDPEGLVTGRPIYGIYVYDFEGFYESEDEVPVFYDIMGNKKYFGSIAYESPLSGWVGQYKLKDLNGDNRIAREDLYYAGTPQPLAYGGWIHELKWKWFDVNLLFNFALGRKMINGSKYSLYTGPKFADLRALDFWEKPGDNADLAKLGYKSEVMVNTHVEKVSSISLKQLTIGCDMPKTWAKKIGLKGARLFLTGENLFYLSNYSGGNPEVIDVYKGVDYGDAYPLPRKWTAGLTLNF